MSTLQQLEERLLQLIKLKEDAVNNHRRAKLVSLDKDIHQLTNRINNLKIND